MSARPSTRPSSLRAALRRATFALGFAAAVGGCTDDGVGPEASPVVISGALTGPKVAELPEGATVAVLWVVPSGSPDYTYVAGRGSIDRATGRFTVTLPASLPPAALNRRGDYGLGVGLVAILAPGTVLADGRHDDDAPSPAAVLGISERYAIIYTSGDPAASPIPWARAFQPGYAAGRGVTVPDDFDTFEPVALGSIEVVVDAMENIELVNWT